MNPEYTYEHKQRMYRVGAYAFPAPPVPTGLWYADAWIRWIDQYGQWLPMVLEKLEREENDNASNTM